ncbi:MAG: hypothetical protein IKU51_02690, partial [Clostridia bacterium]|nr:hypothetical protein [Clostridia bacterium]
KAVQTLTGLGHDALVVHTVHTSLSHSGGFCRRKIILRLQTYCVPPPGKYTSQFVTEIWKTTDKHAKAAGMAPCRFFNKWVF